MIMFCVAVLCCNCNLNPKEWAILSVCIVAGTCLLLARTTSLQLLLRLARRPHPYTFLLCPISSTWCTALFDSHEMASNMRGLTQVR
jgi:hypothetical protein